jgi:BMFP domain-containing protein YqiC
MISNKEEYENCKAQVTRQREELIRTRKQMDELEGTVLELEAQLVESKETYEPVSKEDKDVI